VRDQLNIYPVADVSEVLELALEPAPVAAAAAAA
jgi:predicted ATP-dependent protease